MFNAIMHMIFCINQRPHMGNPNKRSPMSMWAGVNLKMSSRVLKGVIFCLCYGFISPEERLKGDLRSFPAIFLGCNHNERSFKLRAIHSSKTYFVCDVKFVCDIFPYRQQMPEPELRGLRARGC